MPFKWLLSVPSTDTCSRAGMVVQDTAPQETTLVLLAPEGGLVTGGGPYYLKAE